MVKNVRAVWIFDDYGEHAGWMNLDSFLSGEDLVDHWRILYCLLVAGDLKYRGANMQCVHPIALLGWMHRWSKTDYARQANQEYSKMFLTGNLHPMVPPTPSQLLF